MYELDVLSMQLKLVRPKYHVSYVLLFSVNSFTFFCFTLNVKINISFFFIEQDILNVS